MNGAERLLRVMGRMVEQIQDVTDIVYGVVADTWPLRINIGDIQIDENFIVADDEILITMFRGEEVRLLRTNHGQKFYLLKVVDVNGDMDMSYMVWIPDVDIGGTLTWRRVEAKTVPNTSQIAGPAGNRGEQGEQGDVGAKGSAGYKGEKGDRGNKGLPGPIGSTGEKGDTGVAGNDGAKGDQGDQGIKGPTGDQGPGFPSGGKDGQIPVKVGSENYTFQWRDFGGGDMQYKDYDLDKSIRTNGSPDNWLFVKIPFIHDILNIPGDGSMPEPLMDDGDILLLYESAPPSFGTESVYTTEIYVGESIGVM